MGLEIWNKKELPENLCYVVFRPIKQVATTEDGYIWIYIYISIPIYINRSYINSERKNVWITSHLRLIWNQTDVQLIPNESENGRYNLISVWINTISKRFLCALDFRLINPCAVRVHSIQMEVKVNTFWLFIPGYSPFTSISNIENEYI